MEKGTCLDYCRFGFRKMYYVRWILSKKLLEGSRVANSDPNLLFGSHFKLIEGGKTRSAIPGFLFYDD